MSSLQKKIDFAVIFRVRNANPNGDPLNDNRPRINFESFGEVTDVAIKRKIRDRIQESGRAILVQSDDRKVDDFKSLKQRAEAILGNNFGTEATGKFACETWFDVRAFGHLFALQKKRSPARSRAAKTDEGDQDESTVGLSIPIRGPVTVQSAFSVSPIDISSIRITKSVSSEGDGTKRGPDTMGMKHRVDHGVYVFYGSMNPQLAERTGFSDTDALVIKEVLPKLFENDESSARPAGSMEVLKVIWWQHNCRSGQYSSAKVHRSLTVEADGEYTLAKLEDLETEEITGY